MTAHLRTKDVETILEILDGWTDKLTWPALIDRVERRLHRRYTRLALARKPRIADAFALTKQRLTVLPKPSKNVASPAEQLTERLKFELERLAQENRKLLEQHLRWRYNSHLRGVTAEELDRPLPPLQRENSAL